MKDKITNVLMKYLQIFPEEASRQKILINYLNMSDNEDLVDWNNFNGHLVAGGFVYAKEEKKFLVLYHNDLKMYLYPGGHVDVLDNDVLQASKREVVEETGLTNLVQLSVSDDTMVPIDIDTHMIPFNERLQLSEHYHFDFRYLFMIDSLTDIKIDTDELDGYKWVSIDELANDKNYGAIVSKINRLLEKEFIKKF